MFNENNSTRSVRLGSMPLSIPDTLDGGGRAVDNLKANQQLRKPYRLGRGIWVQNQAYMLPSGWPLYLFL